MTHNPSRQDGPAASVGAEMLRFVRESWLNVLLIFVPISLALRLANASAVWVFITAAVAIIPLAGLIGQGTEATTEHTGPSLGGLLNATFGNATELIIALFALHKGLHAVVKASITGSILGNMLLVLGLSMVAGGWKRQSQRFNQTAAAASSGMLMLAVTALVMPAVWELVVFGALNRPTATVHSLSLMTSVVLLVIYAASLLFALVTHRDLYSFGHAPTEAPRFRLRSALTLLLVSTVITAIESEILVGAIEHASASLGLTELFVGVIIVAVVGNAAEHFTAIVVAAKNQMDLAFHIAIGSSTQIALLVAPVLVLTSYLFGNPMDLVFNAFEMVALALAVINVAIVSQDGESNWFEGLQLIAVYVVLALAFYFVPPHR